MVGLPARGKTYISKKLSRYLNWIGINTKGNPICYFIFMDFLSQICCRQQEADRDFIMKQTHCWDRHFWVAKKNVVL